jgi:rare lipoprotein A (peptidoglycan hydrolase)
MWAVFLGLFAAVAAAASAQGASSGGVTDPATPPATSECPATQFGQRPLKLGDCGTDVATLNLLLKSQPVGAGVIPDNQFGDATGQAVLALQQGVGLNASGIVDADVRKALKKGMTKTLASWYGPGFFGNQTSCGVTLDKYTVGVAHRKLPCGTKLTVYAHGHWANAEVIDRGPFVKGVQWDFTQALAEQLGVKYTEKVKVAVAG